MSSSGGGASAADEVDMPGEHGATGLAATSHSNHVHGANQPARAPGKRERDSTFGPTTPSSEEAHFPAAQDDLASSGSQQHLAKKNRIVSRQNTTVGEPFRSNDDLEITPPGTPTLASASVRSNVGSPVHGSAAQPSKHDAEATPPGTPLLGMYAKASALKSAEGTSAASSAPETSRVKEMRKRVEGLTTGDDEMATVNSDLPPVSAAPSSPAPSVEEQIAELPASAAEAERLNEDMHQGDVVISEPQGEEVDTEYETSTSGFAGFPPSAPLTGPAVSALGRIPSLIPPPSPASSVRAEAGSVAGDSEYLADFSSHSGPSSRPLASRQSSISSMRSVQSATFPSTTSTSLTAPHLHFHSALPRSGSVSGLDTPSDALSDISTDVNPPETPRPLADVDTGPLTPLAGGSSLNNGSGDISVPASPSITARGPAYAVNALANASQRPGSASSDTSDRSEQNAGSGSGVQANFGRPVASSFASPNTASAASAGAGAQTSTPSSSKPFVNPFSSFGSSSSSPFASSGNKGLGPPSASSNLSTAKPFGSGFITSGVSPFASAGSSDKPGAFARSSSTGSAGKDAADADVSDGKSEEKEKDKIFSSQAANVDMVTGEEDEFVQYSLPRAKLYVMDGGEWKERGVGHLHLNSKPNGDKLSVRLVMRAEAVHRLILNVSLYAHMSVTLAQDKFVRFSAFEEGTLRHFTVRASNSALGKDLHDQIKDLVELLAAAPGLAGEA